jgi:hypothetical protein
LTIMEGVAPFISSSNFCFSLAIFSENSREIRDFWWSKEARRDLRCRSSFELSWEVEEAG